MINYYTLMNVSPTIPDADLKTALYAALRQWKNRENHRQLEQRQEAERNVSYLEEAKNVLFDHVKRAAYDKQLATAEKEEKPVKHEEISADNLIEEGWRLLAEGNIAEALHAANRATEQQANNPDAWALLAQAKFRWGDAEDAIYEYKRAIRLRSNDASLYFDLGCVYDSENRLNDALQQYSRAAMIDSGTPMYRAARGAVMAKNENYSEAIPILEQCVLEDRTNDAFQWFLAIAYANSAQLEWTFVPENNPRGLPSGYYATTREQVVHAQTLLTKAAGLSFDDQELSAHIRSVRRDIDSMMERKFQGSIIIPIVGGLVWSIFYGIGILFAIAYFMVSRPPRYAINKYVLRGITTADAAMFAGESPGSGLLVAAFTGLFLPVMVIVNYVRYHTGENATPALHNA